MIDLFIARQPIYANDGPLRIFAYELLCRSGKANSYPGGDELHATSQVIFNTFAEVGVERLVGTYPAFLKVPRQFLLGDYHMSVPQHRVFYEIRGDDMDPQAVAAVKRLAERGYHLALRGLPKGTEAQTLLPHVEILKLDMRGLGEAGLRQMVPEARKHRVKICVEKVETPGEYELCRSLKVDYVQGYFFCKPRMHEAKQIAPNRLALLDLMAKFNDPKVSIEELTKSVIQDVTLSYKLLRTLNSAFYSLPSKIHSIRQGLVMLGIERVKAWVTVILLSKLADKPQELMVTALVRAQMCEQLARPLYQARNAETFFMVGLFSVLDAMMDCPMSLVLSKLPLADEVVQALLHQAGPAGAALRSVLAYERGEFGAIPDGSRHSTLLCNTYLESVAWADSISRTLLSND